MVLYFLLSGTMLGQQYRHWIRRVFNYVAGTKLCFYFQQFVFNEAAPLKM